MKCKCINCLNLLFDSGEPGYSDLTPGTDWRLLCVKNLWSLCGDETTHEQFVSALNDLRKCDFFIKRKIGKQTDFNKVDNSRLVNHLKTVWRLKHNYDDISSCVQIKCKHIHSERCDSDECKKIVDDYLHGNIGKEGR